MGMARRIAVAMLLTLWVMLVTGGSIAYFYTRSLLLADFDQTIVDRACSLWATQQGATRDISERFPEDRFVVTNQRGQIVSRPAETAAPTTKPVVLNREFTTLAQGDRIRCITLRMPATAKAGAATVVYSRPTESIDRILDRLRLALAGSGLAAGILATYISFRVARAALRPLRATAEVIGSIDDAHLDRRIEPTSLPPELQPMAQRLNGMLDRLEQAFAQRKQFLADASHELRTPIAALLTTIEVAMRRQQSEAELRSTIANCLGDAQTLRQLVESLMQQARSENFHYEEPCELVDLPNILRETVHVAEQLAVSNGVRVSFKCDSTTGFYTQPNRLRSVLRNILNNAVEHNRPGGSVELDASASTEELTIVIRDSGMGIAAEHLPHLFEPFYRADKARQDGQHLGLGLFLVQSHLKALGGSCQVQSTVGAGTVFRLRLPIREPSLPNRDKASHVGVAI
jgi:signal transduction histidine kinase